MTAQEHARFMSPEQGRQFYGLREVNSLFPSDLDRALAINGIARVVIPLTDTDFKQVIDGYETALAEWPELLGQTAYRLDNRMGNEVGHSRREPKIDNKTGLQISDAKNFMHVTEGGAERWLEQFADGPVDFLNFLRDSRELHHAIIEIGQQQFSQLEETYPNITRAHFEQTANRLISRSFMRLLSYDAYDARQTSGEVAKPHFDIGSFTLQAYADAPGFWGASEGVHGERTFHNTEDGEAYLFAGKGFEKLYGPDTRIRPLWHGVDRVVVPGVEQIPKRHTIVTFYDAPRVDYRHKVNDLLPYMPLENSEEAAEPEIDKAAVA